MTSAASTPAAAPSLLDRVAPFVRRGIRPALWLLVVLPLLWLIVRLVLSDLGANPIEKLEMETGRWTLRLLAASLAITPLIRFTHWGWLIPQRRFLGLATFAYAAVHLMVYVGLDHFFAIDDIVEDVLKHLYVTVGMVGFVLLLVLAITSTKGWVKRLGGRRWKLLHRLAYAAAIAGCIHFLWAVKKDITEPLIYAAVFVVLFALRLVSRKVGGKHATSSVRPAA